MSMLYNQFFALNADHELKLNLTTMTLEDKTANKTYKMGYEFGTLFVKGV